MEFLRRIFSSVWKIWFVANFVFIFLLLYPLVWVLLRKRKWFGHVFVIQKFLAWWVTFFAFIYIKKYNRNKSEIPKPCVVVANHASYLDIVISYLFLPHYFVFMGKHELAQIPLFKTFFKEMNIAVNRGSKTAAHKAFLRAAEEIGMGNSVYIFPEGGIHDNWGELSNFKNGAFKLAIDKQVPILPVVYINNWRILQIGGFFKSYGSPGIANIVIHEPIPTKGMSDENLVSLRQEVFELTKKTLQEFKRK